MTGLGDYDPFEHAERLGVEVVYGRIRSTNALWVPERRTIIMKRGLRRLVERSALAHELGHVCLGHRDDRPRHEILADRWAAQHLITPKRLAEVMAETEDPGTWCVELDVTPHMLETYFKLAVARGGWRARVA